MKYPFDLPTICPSLPARQCHPQRSDAFAIAPLRQPGLLTALSRHPTPPAYLPRPVTAFPFAPRDVGRAYCCLLPPWLCRAEALPDLAFAAFFALASLCINRARTHARTRQGDPHRPSSVMARYSRRSAAEGSAPRGRQLRQSKHTTKIEEGVGSHRRALARAVARAAADWSRFFLISSIDAPNTPRPLVFALRVFFSTRFSPSAPFLCMRRYSYAQGST